MRKSTPLVRDSDRMAAAALLVDRLGEWVYIRTLRRAEALPEECRWTHHLGSDAAIRSECESAFPGPRSAWVR